MCCFAQPVTHVSDTSIFARLLGGGRQVLAYRMSYASERPNAMILPLPVALPAREESVRFVALDHYDDLFDDLGRGFPDLRPPRHWGRDTVAMPAAAADRLVVHEVGDFIASFVPAMEDFVRLDPQFVIPREAWDQIPGYGDYGFAVFQLRNLAGRPHPMAFEFDSRWEDRIFFPTVHIHDGQVHPREEFDHCLYLQDQRFDGLAGPYRGPWDVDARTGFVRSHDVAAKFCRAEDTRGLVQPDLLVHRFRLQGTLPNRDTIQLVSGVLPGRMASPQSGRWMDWRVGTGVLGAMGLAWLIRRRNRLMGGDRPSPAGDSA